jgi:Protein of unknown function (DUF3843)
MRNKSFLQKFTVPKQVTLADWLAMKPYDTPINNYDNFYLQQCQKVHSILKLQDVWFKKHDVSHEQFRELSCQLVSYFEDYIVEIGLWSSFIEHNKELYHYPLPFYDLTDYDETYINVEDIAFLIWHYLTKYTPEEYIMNPDHDCIMMLSESIFKHFETVMDDAPAIDLYNNFFTIKDDEDYFVFKTKMKWFSTESYLIGVDLGKKYTQLKKEILEEGKLKKTEPAKLGIVVYSMIEKYLYQKRSSFSALNGPEWFAKIAKCSDTRRQEIIDLTYWIDGKFFMKERQKTHFVFEHIYTKIEYKALIDSFQNNKDMQPRENDAYVMHLVRWNGEYLLSGMMYTEQMTPTTLKKYKTDPLSTPWILTESYLEKIRESTNNTYEAFLEYFGSPLAIFDSDAEATKNYLAFLNFYSKKVKPDVTDSFEERSKNFTEKVGKENSSVNSLIQTKDYKKSVALFFDKEVGVLTLGAIKETIHKLQAPQLTGQEQADLFLDFANGYNPDFCAYLLTKFETKNLKYPTKDIKVKVIKHLPFFWRMNSPEEFDRKYPMMTLVDADLVD